VNDRLKMLWPTGVHEKKVLILYSDSAAYMQKAANALKIFYLNLIHFTCLAHVLQHVAEEDRATFLQVDKFISMTKILFLKAPHQVQSYKKHFPDETLPSEPVPTKWGTWIEAVNFYSEHFETVLCPRQEHSL
jgi:hypothetical protein